MGKNILLGRHILRHVPVHIQMVGRQIGDDRNVRTLRHGHQLEAGQLQHRKIRAQHSVRLAQQRVADIAAHPHTLSGLFQQLGNDGGGRRLSVRAGDSDDRTRADPEENLHFTGQNGAFLNTGRYLRHIRAQPRCAEDHVRLQILQIIRTQVQLAAKTLQVFGLLPHLLAGTLIAGGNAQPFRRKQLQQRRVADADADDRHKLISNRVHIFPQGHRCLPPQIFYLTNILYRNRRDFQLAFSFGNPENPLWQSTAVILHKSGRKICVNVGRFTSLHYRAKVLI